MGQPFKVAELMAQLDGPIYVERVALFNAKERLKAKKAIKKSLQLQVEGKGFSLVEVLAECPTHLKLSPIETEKWVRENMVPVFPLGVKKDVAGGAFKLAPPTFEVERVMRAVAADAGEKAPAFMKGFPGHVAEDDISLKLAGSGGDGAQTAAMLIARAAINEGFDSTHIPSYGPESRGGTSYADVHVAREEVLSPASAAPNILIAFNAPSLVKFGPSVAPGGTILYDSSVISEPPRFPQARMWGVPFARIAAELGKAVVKNIVALGALHACTGLFPKETFLEAIRRALKSKSAMVSLNEEAFARGVKATPAMPSFERSAAP